MLRSRSKSRERKAAAAAAAAAAAEAAAAAAEATAAAAEAAAAQSKENGDVQKAAPGEPREPAEEFQIPVQVEREAPQTPPSPEKAWKEVSTETRRTRVVLHGGDSQGDRTLTLEHVTSLRKPDDTVDSRTARDSYR
ncbi:hypothetical protein E2C01_027577 [Portunus trituberculatus]|uniref:Uncharacterized protein n=1 Tax=Portunus trituberculatus TaxID=210409 RepID=A0A5B7ELP0_PORTR|nr:hypothetical protein [Portunus trituberculatus]